MGVVVITGSNRGIGFELAKQVKQSGASVIAVCRKSSKELDGLGVRVEAGVDVSEPESIAQLAKTLAGQSIDLLINNAGVLRAETFKDAGTKAVLEQFTINALGPLLVTQALAPLMHEGSKVAVVTSRMGSITDNDSGGMYGYRMSKAALNACAKSMAIDLKPKQIAVVILHPGFVRTDMTGGNGLVDPPESAQGLIARIEELTLETSGAFKHMNGETLPW